MPMEAAGGTQLESNWTGASLKLLRLRSQTFDLPRYGTKDQYHRRLREAEEGREETET